MDLISDMLTRIRNACMAKNSNLVVLYSKLNMAILAVLKSEGYIQDFEEVVLPSNQKEIRVVLKDFSMNTIREIRRISKSSRRVYTSVDELPLLYNGLGIYVLSTSKGVISDSKARELKVGGEIICSVF